MNISKMCIPVFMFIVCFVFILSENLGLTCVSEFCVLYVYLIYALYLSKKGKSFL